MSGVRDEEGFVAPAGGERHVLSHRWKRRPWLLRAFRITPLALTVAFVVIAASLRAAPPSQQSRVARAIRIPGWVQQVDTVVRLVQAAL